MDCIFCEIIRGSIPSQKVFENEAVYAFRDIKPCAPVHILIVPKAHIASADETTPMPCATFSLPFPRLQRLRV